MTAELLAECPHCGRVNEAHDGPTPGARPEPGDVSICWKCGGIGIFESAGIRKPTAAEQAELSDLDEVKQARAVIAESYMPSEASSLRWGSL